MTDAFISEPITPAGDAFFTPGMAIGGPGLPEGFRRGREDFRVAEVLGKWRDLGPCSHGSGERYLRRHWFRIRTDAGVEMTIYFERQGRTRKRWRLQSIVRAVDDAS